MGNLGNKAIMSKNIQYYMNLHQKSRTEMCNALGVKYTTFTDWVKGNAYPRIDKIELMANYFGITKADLVEEKSTTDIKMNKAGEIILTDEERQLIINFRNLNNDGKTYIKQTMDMVKDKYKKCDSISELEKLG